MLVRIGAIGPCRGNHISNGVSCRPLAHCDGKGGELHLTYSVDDWLVPGRNPFGLYLYTDDVDAVAAGFASELAGKRGPEEKP